MADIFYGLLMIWVDRCGVHLLKDRVVYVLKKFNVCYDRKNPWKCMIIIYWFADEYFSNNIGQLVEGHKWLINCCYSFKDIDWCDVMICCMRHLVIHIESAIKDISKMNGIDDLFFLTSLRKNRIEICFWEKLPWLFGNKINIFDYSDFF